MNRLEITMKYMTAKTKIKRPSKYKKAVKLHHKILKQCDEKIREYYSKKESATNVTLTIQNHYNQK